jgi:hypothetical protein
MKWLRRTKEEEVFLLKENVGFTFQRKTSVSIFKKNVGFVFHIFPPVNVPPRFVMGTSWKLPEFQFHYYWIISSKSFPGYYLIFCICVMHIYIYIYIYICIHIYIYLYMHIYRPYSHPLRDCPVLILLTKHHQLRGYHGVKSGIFYTFSYREINQNFNSSTPRWG